MDLTALVNTLVTYQDDDPGTATGLITEVRPFTPADRFCIYVIWGDTLEGDWFAADQLAPFVS